MQVSNESTLAATSSSANSTSGSPLPEAAVGYATNLGWPLFPLAPWRNAPPLIEAWPERATADATIIDGWWATWPAANIGLHCAGLLVLDVDPRHDGPASLGALLDTHGRLTPTPVQRTPGGGWHYLYRCSAPLSNSAGQLGRRLDVRTRGGCIALAPSVRRDGSYRWVRGFAPDEIDLAEAPEWLVHLLRPKPPPPRSAPSIEASDRLIAFALARDLDAVACAPDGQRNHTLYCKARGLARFDIPRADFVDDLLAAALTAGLSQSEALATINSRPSLAERTMTWQNLLDRTKHGVRATLRNAAIALREDDRIKGKIAFNDFTDCVVVIAALPWSRPATAHGPSMTILCAAEWLQEQDIHVIRGVAHDAANLVAYEKRYHPVVDWLESLKWDGSERLTNWLSTYLGVPKSPLANAFGRAFMISAVARVMRPAARLTTCPFSRQARRPEINRANTLVGDEWFTDQIADIGTKDSSQDLRGKWVIELSELSAIRPHEAEKVKAYITSRCDHYRPSYGRQSRTFPRQTVFVGTRTPVNI